MPHRPGCPANPKTIMQGRTPSLMPADNMKSTVVSITTNFCWRMQEVERRLTKSGVTVPPLRAKQEVADAFWEMAKALEECTSTADRSSLETLKEIARREIGFWTWRSPCMNRSFFKPHGYSGDYKMIEMMYDLEHTAKSLG